MADTTITTALPVPVDKTKFRNVILHSVSFLFLFTAFQTSTGISQRVLTGYSQETENSSSPFVGIDGYKSNAVLYIFFAVFNWFAPVVVAVLKARMSMALGAATYAIYVSAYIYPNTGFLYFTSALVGLGAAVLWTAQGAFISDNSSDETRQKNNGIFWAFLQFSLIFGNLYVYVVWKGVKEIFSAQRVPLYIIFTALSGVGALGFLTVTNTTQAPDDEEEEKARLNEGGSNSPPKSPVDDSHAVMIQDASSSVASSQESTLRMCLRVIKEAFLLLPTINMLIILITFAYTGLSLSYWSSVYPTCVAATKSESFGHDSDRLMGINGITTGLGQVIGGLLFSMIPSLAKRADKKIIVLLGGGVHLAAFTLIYANFGSGSDELENCESGEGALFNTSRYYVSVIVAFMLGFGDCCFNTQVYTHLGWYYKENPAPAFAIFKSIQSVFTAISFFVVTSMKLKWQLALLASSNLISIVSFVALCVKTKREREESSS